MTSALRIVCFGSSRVVPTDPTWKLADAVGYEIGRRGLTVVSGGYGGAMGAVSEGGRRGGGQVYGVTTPIFTERQGNAHLHQEYQEPDYPSRLAALLRQGHGFVALPGALGTVSEWVTAWCLATIDQLGGPLWLFEDPWKPLAESMLRLPESNPEHASQIIWVSDAEDLGRKMDAWLEARPARRAEEA